MIRNISILLAFTLAIGGNSSDARQRSQGRDVWVPDNGDGTYSNPVIFADYSDPDVIRVGENFYLVSSSFNCVPGLPILQSHDLVNWKIIGHVFARLPSPIFGEPQHGKGCWAPSIRYHNGEFWVYYADPDLGIFMAKSKRPEGAWGPLVLVREAKGWIDPSPLWDDDGNAYLVHAWAKSRAGFNSILTVNRMSNDGLRILDDGVTVFDGHKNQPTIEGPKFYKRSGYYYIFAPAGGVPTGWQVVLRSRSVDGPYEDKIVLHQGSTNVNGPHQGGWVETKTGGSWFVHFQELGAYGRIIHLEPMVWKDDWPVIGVDTDGDGNGVPVSRWKKPDVGRQYPVVNPQTSDEFESKTLGLQWQWEANAGKRWLSLAAKRGSLRLYSVATPESTTSLWDVPNLLLQKFPAPKFSATTLLRFQAKSIGEKTGLLVMGRDYSFIGLVRAAEGTRLTRITRRNADRGMKEEEEAGMELQDGPLYLRVEVDTGAVCRFSYSKDGKAFEQLGRPFKAREGVWIGAKVGIFNTALHNAPQAGYSDFEWFRVERPD